MESLESVVKLLAEYGPWALVALLTSALGWLARMYVKTRDENMKALLAITEKSVAANLQASENFLDVQKTLERLERQGAEIERELGG